MPLKEMFESEKLFKLWEYTVSHSTLLIRHHAAESNYNVDIIFSSVFHLDTPNQFDGIEIIEPTEEEVVYLGQKCGKEKVAVPDFKFYVLKSNEQRHYIGASSCVIYENDWEHDSGLLDYWNKSEEARLVSQNLNPAAQQY